MKTIEEVPQGYVVVRPNPMNSIFYKNFMRLGMSEIIEGKQTECERVSYRGLEAFLCTTSHAKQLLPNYQENFELLSPGDLECIGRKSYNRVEVLIKSVFSEEEKKGKPDPQKTKLDGKSVDELREFADANNIEYKGNWGVKKLTETIVKLMPELLVEE